MSTDTIREIAGITPVARDTDAREVAVAAYEQLLGQLARLGPDDWLRPTACTAWHVADMLRHLVGAARSNASVRELIRQQVSGKRHAKEHGGNALDATNALQVKDHAALSPGELITELRRLAPKAVAGRMSTPGLVRRVTLPMDPGGSTPAGTPSTLPMHRLLDVVYTRDVWLHSVDIERATGIAVVRGPVPDGRIVEDVVRDWASQHGAHVELTLTGPPGGRFRQGTGGDHLELDAIDFCLAVSGRAPGPGLLAHRVIF
jgi:uncharacterized protein (TIGR03083 family)